MFLNNWGKATLAKTPTITITTRSSNNVNPDLLLLMLTKVYTFQVTVSNLFQCFWRLRMMSQWSFHRRPVQDFLNDIFTRHALGACAVVEDNAMAEHVLCNTLDILGRHVTF